MSAKLAAALAVATSLIAPSTAGAAEFAPGQLLVRFEPGTSKAESAALAAGEGAQVVERYEIVPRLMLVDLPAGLGVNAAERRFEGLGDVSFAQPNRVYHEALAPDDPFFNSSPNALWGLNNTGQAVPNDNPTFPTLTAPPFPTETPIPAAVPDADIDAPEAWDTETGHPAVTVGVIDSGITLAHEDLDGNLWENPEEVAGNIADDDDGNGRVDDVYGWDFIENDATPDDASGHGTHVAGAVGAEGMNALGITGASWDVSIAGLKAGSADGRLYSSTIIAAVQYADAMDFPIVNGSYVGGGSDDPPDAERIAYGNAGVPDAPGEQGTLFVVAAGNSAANVDTTPGTASFPCAYTLPNILCVAATTPSDGLASFSNFGVRSADVGAPGTNALSTEPTFAAPVFEDNFEDGTLGKWVIGGTPANSWFNSQETPTLGDDGLNDSPGGDYTNNEDSWIRMATPVSLAGMESCRLNMASEFELATGDQLRTEYTTDAAPGPASAWNPLFSLNVPYTGNGVFAFRNLDMDMMGATGEAHVTVRFRLVTNSTGTADGVHLDDVQIECVDAAPGAQNGFRVRQGTSMASPVAAGVAALVLANDPGRDLTVAELRNTLLASVDPRPSLRCRTTTGGRINAATALATVPATAVAPPAPDCTSQGTDVPTPIVDPPVEKPKVKQPGAKKPKKCKKPKKSARAKAKAKYRKCKRKRKAR